MNAFRSKVSFNYQSVSNRTATELPLGREPSSWFFVGKTSSGFSRRQVLMWQRFRYLLARLLSIEIIATLALILNFSSRKLG
jgi:hypothetical protein